MVTFRSGMCRACHFMGYMFWDVTSFDGDLSKWDVSGMYACMYVCVCMYVCSMYVACMYVYVACML